MDTREPVDPCAFDTLFTRSVPHILEKIFLSLDNYESFQRCLEVSKKWNEVLASESFQEKAKAGLSLVAVISGCLVAVKCQIPSHIRKNV